MGAARRRPMRWGELLCAAAGVCLLCGGPPAWAATARTSVALEYDDNPFEQSRSRRSAWVSRLYVHLSSQLLERDWGSVALQHQWGLKRFWEAEPASGGEGDVLASNLDLAGSLRLHPRLHLQWGGDLKTKNAQRLSSEESYLRGGVRAGLTAALDERFSTQVELTRSGDDARDLRFADVTILQLTAGVAYRRDRSLSARLDYHRHRLSYDRPALGEGTDGGEPVELAESQDDRAQEWAVEVQHYRGGLLQAAYSFMDNGSNSLGYGFRAHTLRVVLTRGLLAGVDGQVFATGQHRRYDHPTAAAVTVAAAQVQDEYEQALVALKLARRIAGECDLSCEYRFSRNGSRGQDSSFRKNVFTLALDAGI